MCRFGLLVLILAGAKRAHAQPSVPNAAAAQALFDQAVALMERGDFQGACPKLTEADLLLPGKIGLKLRLAECYVGEGRITSAWTTYRSAESVASAAGEEARASYAREQASALEGRLTRLTIVVPEVLASLPGLVVLRDGARVGPGQWSTPVPVDPGVHVVSASAPEMESWRTSSQIEPGTRDVTITIPALRVAPPASAAPSPPPSLQASPRSSTSPPDHAMGAEQRFPQETIGAMLGAAGVVGLGVGAVFGLQSMSKKGDADAECQFPGNKCSEVGVLLRDDAISAGNAATIAFIAGGVATAAGIVLVLATPEDRSPRVALQLGASGLDVKGAW